MEHHTDAGALLVLDVLPSFYLNSTQKLIPLLGMTLLVMFFHSQSKTQLATFMQYKLITNMACLSLTAYWNQCFLIGYWYPLAETEAPCLSRLQTARSENILNAW